MYLTGAVSTCIRMYRYIHIYKMCAYIYICETHTYTYIPNHIYIHIFMFIFSVKIHSRRFLFDLTCFIEIKTNSTDSKLLALGVKTCNSLKLRPMALKVSDRVSSHPSQKAPAVVLGLTWGKP